MIIEGLVALLAGVVELVFSALGSAPAPGFVSGLGSQLNSVIGLSASMGGWIPWTVVGSAVAAVAGAYLISLAVKVVRILISLFTGGGGSAA